MDALEQLLIDARNGRFDQPPTKRLIPFKELKAELLQNPEVRAEYERLRPEFEQVQVAIKKRSHPTSRRVDERREYLMDYIPPQKNGKNPLYAAVLFAIDLMREGQSPAYANGWAAKKYRVEKSDVAHYTGQHAARVGVLKLERQP